MLEMGQKLRMWPIRPHCPDQRALEAEPRPGAGLGEVMEPSRPTFHGDVLDGEAEDDGPDHAQGHFSVPIHDFYKNSSRMGRTGQS